jgi:hypothetical protein
MKFEIFKALKAFEVRSVVDRSVLASYGTLAPEDDTKGACLEC